jgi:hypothetical protein
MAQLNFNGADQEAMDDFSVVPAGPYNVQVVKSEVTKTKAETGTLLKLQFKIIDGKFKGRIIFGQYNLTNPNAQAVEISRKQMKTLCDAIGKPDGVGDSNEMHNIPLQIKVSIKPAQGVYAEQNEIKFYSKYEGPAVEGNTENSGASNPGNPAASDAGGAESSKPNGGGEAKAETGGGAPWNKN